MSPEVPRIGFDGASIVIFGTGQISLPFKFATCQIQGFRIDWQHLGDTKREAPGVILLV